MAYVHKLVAEANARRIARGVDGREWFVNEQGQMRLRWRSGPKQVKMNLDGVAK